MTDAEWDELNDVLLDLEFGSPWTPKNAAQAAAAEEVVVAEVRTLTREGISTGRTVLERKEVGEVLERLKKMRRACLLLRIRICKPGSNKLETLFEDHTLIGPVGD